jgi:hypothetical protein
MDFSKGSIAAVAGAFLALIVGGGLIAYGFELVSIPGIQEFREGVYVWVGLAIVVVGGLFAGLTLFRGKSA